MEKTVKVRTIIGVVVEMPKSVYEANKHIYSLVESEKEDEVVKTEPSKAEIVARLKELNVEFKLNATKEVLQTLLDETIAKVEAKKQAETPKNDEVKTDDLETPETETKVEDETKVDETLETEVKTTDLQPEENTAETNITNTAM